ncbi:sulfite exporter TauE/SafE family protein [Micromonospora coxensis]|uniref:sulfite exporter TauE/SafE family protein n=1 Tax=Micromonospora coxensis TaxID=356852 RepID=UPI0018D56EE6|nr:sulfite exporter TauE/SafE family protein [Micromonospora coxensis]
MTALAVAIFVGAGTQRVTGLGFALVASPFVVLLTDPFNGVLLVNLCGALTALAVLVQVWRDVDVRRAGLLLGPALVAVLPGAWVARNLPAPVLAVVVGGLVLAALAAVLTRGRAGRRADGPPEPRAAGDREGASADGVRASLLAGAGSGFMSVTAGVGGPAITVYAVSTGWSQRSFAATAQLVFAALGVASLLAKGSLPALPAAGWALVGTGLAVGVLIGNRLSDRVPAHRARRAVVALALTGAAITVAKGVAQL